MNKGLEALSNKVLEIVKDLIYIDVNNQVRSKPKNKTLTATESLDSEKADLLKEILK